MKKYISIIIAVFTLALTSCIDEGKEFDTNGGKGLTFTHFAVASQTIKVNEAVSTALITVSSTAKADVARSYTIIADPKSEAIEGTHYTLSSKTVTIPAGEYHGTVTLTANLDNVTKNPISVKFSLADHADIIDWGKNMTATIQIFCDLDPSMLLGTFSWVSASWGESGSGLTFEADPNDPYKIYIDGLPTEAITWNGNKIELNVNPSNNSISGPKVIVAGDTHEWGDEDNYDDYAMEPISGEFDTCQGTFSIVFRISVKQGTFGSFGFIFSK